MKNKRTLIICTIIIVLLVISTSVLAVDTNQYKPTDPTDTEEFTEIGGNFISIIQFVGILLAVIMIVVIGIKYMLGSVEEKAEFKQTMGPYIVGCILLVCSSALVGIIGNTISSGGEQHTNYEWSIQATYSGQTDGESFVKEYKKNKGAVIDKYFEVCINIDEATTNDEKNYWIEYKRILEKHLDEQGILLGKEDIYSSKELTSEQKYFKGKYEETYKSDNEDLEKETKEGKEAANKFIEANNASEIYLKYNEVYKTLQNKNIEEGVKAYCQGYCDRLQEYIDSTGM